MPVPSPISVRCVHRFVPIWAADDFKLGLLNYWAGEFLSARIGAGRGRRGEENKQRGLRTGLGGLGWAGGAAARASALEKSLTRPSLFLYFREIRKK